MEFNGLNTEGREKSLIGLLGKLFLVVINCSDVGSDMSIDLL